MLQPPLRCLSANLDRVFRLTDAVRDAARCESEALAACTSDALMTNVALLRDAHLRELDLVHALCAAITLVARHRPQFFAELDRVVALAEN